MKGKVTPELAKNFTLEDQSIFEFINKLLFTFIINK